ncbi:MAG: sulfatase [Caldilineaceae bacterium]|nr:sulfatase [Caldilineaceae bacterium]
MASRNAQRPNILWISTHDINPHLGCYAGIYPDAAYACTPNLDRMAGEGVRYDNALATTPVCGPSRSAIITGMYPTAIGTMHMRTKAVPPAEVRPIPEILRGAGYYCTNNAFTDYQFHTPATVFDDFGPQAHWRNRPDPDQPFFAMFHGMVTHESQIYTDDERFAHNTRRLTAAQRHDPDAAPVPPVYPDTPVFRQAVARYNDLITAMDYWAGDILDQLAEDGLAHNTLVIFWSDHGRGFPREKRWPYECGLRVPLIARWPGKLAPGTHRTAPVCTMDLAATMPAVAGLPVPAYMQARPLFDAAGVHAPVRDYIFGHRDRMGETEDTVRTVRDARFRYLRNLHPDRPYMQHQEYADQVASTWQELRTMRFQEAGALNLGLLPTLLTPAQRHFLSTTKPPEELYDLTADPYETNNLAADPAYAGELLRLSEALDAWGAAYPDLGMLPEAELLQSRRPTGRFAWTEAPQVSSANGLLTATCATPGGVIGWTDIPPGHEASSDQEDPLAAIKNAAGDPEEDGRAWRLYTGPFSSPVPGPLWFRAHRIGFLASRETAYPKE